MRRLNRQQATIRYERIARRVARLRAKKITNEYLANMAARGFVPVPETIEEIKNRGENGTVNS